MEAISANYEMEANYSYSTTNDDVTLVGFDVGESKLLMRCAL
ncbi:hypothetical protein [Haloquadratum walsbyi]|nr:hypothetical protein [Haloquadratum walsbyi]